MPDLANTEARVNLTWNGQNSDLPNPVYVDTPDSDIKNWLAEAVRNGDMPGMSLDLNVDLENYVVDRFQPTEERPWHLIAVRPKTPFGS
jgi:hypothetical protein